MPTRFQSCHRMVLARGVLFAFLFWLPTVLMGDERVKPIAIGQDEAASALDRGLKLLMRGAANYPRHRDCFSCHHQTLPMLPISMVRKPFEARDQAMADDIESTSHQIAEFTLASFHARQSDLIEGRVIDGKGLTVGYGLWTLDLAQQSPNATIDAMVAHLLMTQHEDGYWEFHSLRPPASSSRFMTSAIALFGIQCYATDDEALRKAKTKLKSWLAAEPRPNTNEDTVGFVWCSYLIDPGHETKLAKLILDRQQSDGGWAQQPDMESDSYATGQSLVMLAQLQGGYQLPIRQQPSFRRGLRFLLDHQAPDGSWHVVSRADPVQEYFDNEDPYGSDQFISMMGTGWACASIAYFLQRESDQLGGPLGSRRKAHRASHPPGSAGGYRRGR